jgi:hypothetical protein
MDKDVESSSGDSNWAVNQQLPAVIPVPRPPVSVRSIWRLALPRWRLMLVAVLAAGAGVIMAFLSPFQNMPAPAGRPAPQRHEAALPAVDGAASLAAPIPPVLVPSTPVLATPVPSHPIQSNSLRGAADTPPAGDAGDAGNACHGAFPAPQLEVSGKPTVMPADAAASLGLAINGAPDGAQLIICGFAARSVFSAGHSIDDSTWVLSVSEAADLTLIPPRGFVGPMKLVVALVNTDRSLADRRTLTLQWMPLQQTSGVPAATAPRIANINEQLEEGKRLKAAGNLAGSRAIFQRYAQTGDSRAAFLLAETYDPISLAKHQLLPPDSDPEKARLWYRRASEHGSMEANARLDRLSNW